MPHILTLSQVTSTLKKIGPATSHTGYNRNASHGGVSIILTFSEGVTLAVTCLSDNNPFGLSQS